MRTLRLKNVRWINPWGSANCDQHIDLAWEDGQWRPIDDTSDAIDASNYWLLPAFVDCHQHLARPQHATRLADELHAAWRNGFASVCAAPDCAPVIDNASVIEWIERSLGERIGLALPELKLLGALTPDLQGQQLADMGALIEAGCAGLGHADAALPGPDLLRQAMRYASDLGATLHLSPTLASFAGCAHEGANASALGLDGVPAVAETLAVSIITELVRDTGCHVHLSKLSSADALKPLRQARTDKLPISASVCLWNLLFTDEQLKNYQPEFHLQPPLRSETDREALIAAVADGSIDAICSDHRPLGFDDKFGPFAETRAGANGVDGFICGLMQLLAQTTLNPLTVMTALSRTPARIVGSDLGEPNWLLIATDARDEVARLSRCPSSPLGNNPGPGRLVARTSPDGLWIDEHWQAPLGV